MTEKMTPEKELELINGFATVPLKGEDVFTFTVTLCDNEVDRDSECFTAETLEQLGRLFVGKTGISDHSMRSKDQCARIFHTFTERNGTKNSAGEEYVALRARAYMLRNEQTASLINEIEGGIKKEVSVSCSVNKSLCSICGADMRHHGCKHVKGRYYDSQLCYALLSEPTDAYEWSFVAVPAQRNAGVTKAYIRKEDDCLNNPNEIIKALCPQKALSETEIKCLKEHICALEKAAEQAEGYKAQLTGEIERLALLAMPMVNVKAFTEGCRAMDIDKLIQLREGLEAQVREKLPVALQLKAATPVSRTDKNNEYRI